MRCAYLCWAVQLFGGVQAGCAWRQGSRMHIGGGRHKPRCAIAIGAWWGRWRLAARCHLGRSSAGAGWGWLCLDLQPLKCCCRRCRRCRMARRGLRLRVCLPLARLLRPCRASMLRKKCELLHLPHWDQYNIARIDQADSLRWGHETWIRPYTLAFCVLLASMQQ